MGPCVMGMLIFADFDLLKEKQIMKNAYSSFSIACSTLQPPLRRRPDIMS